MAVLAFISTTLFLMLASFIAGVCIGKRAAKKEE
jgi:hypothetical protein